MRSSFNYNEEPVVLGINGKPRTLMSAVFAQDFEKYPRSDRGTPPWLAARVTEGRAQLTDLAANSPTPA